MTQDPEVFEDTDKFPINLTEDDLLGKHFYSDVLYTGEKLEEAKSFAKQTQENSKTNHFRVARNVEQLGGPFNNEYESVVFYNRKITGSLEWATVFNKAVKSDSYNVVPQANYYTGSVTINVTKK